MVRTRDNGETTQSTPPPEKTYISFGDVFLKMIWAFPGHFFDLFSKSGGNGTHDLTMSLRCYHSHGRKKATIVGAESST